MERAKTILTLIIILMTSTCYAEIIGTVVDADTGKPIEGAVVLVEWTITKGLPRMSYGETYEVKEALTDKEGKIDISGVLNPFVGPPCVTIYKKGYVAWNSESIFPGYKKRTDFEWRKDYVFRLEKFREEYTYNAHTSFIRDAIHSGIAPGRKDVIKKAFEWEEEKAFQERQEKRKKEKD